MKIEFSNSDLILLNELSKEMQREPLDVILMGLRGLRSRINHGKERDAIFIRFEKDLDWERLNDELTLWRLQKRHEQNPRGATSSAIREQQSKTKSRNWGRAIDATPDPIEQSRYQWPDEDRMREYND